MAQGYSVLFEGAQATLLDLDHGTYPFVTCSAAAAGGACDGLRRRADAHRRRPRRRQGLLHAGRHRSLSDARCRGAGRPRTIRERGGEYGATTGRPRRCGWFDAVAVRYAVRVNGFDALAITKLDVLDELDEIRVCTGYRFEGETLDGAARRTPPSSRPASPSTRRCPAGRRRRRACATGARLPENARRYLERLAELVGTEIGLVSTGPDREQTIIRSRSALASWFD